VPPVTPSPDALLALAVRNDDDRGPAGGVLHVSHDIGSAIVVDADLPDSKRRAIG